MGSVIVVKGMWQSWWVRVSVIAGFGLLVRLAFVLGVTRFDEPVGDQLYYSAQALTNARGEWFEQPFAQGMPAADHPPLTSFLLTPVTWLTEASGSFITAQRLTMTLIGVASIVIMAMMGRLLAGDRVGTIAAVITAVYANVWVNDGLVMAETPTFFLVAISTLLALTYRRRHDIASMLGLGVTAGLMALTRPELAVVTVLGAALVFSAARTDLSLATRSKRAALVLATSLVIVSPWILWNQSRFSDSVFISTNDGLTLAGANCDSTFYGDVGSWDIWCAYETPVPIDADASLASKLMRRDGLAYLRDHIGRYPTVAAARVARVLSVGFIGSNNNAAKSEGRPTGVSMLGVIQFWLIVAAAGFGLRRLSNRADQIILAVLLPFVILVAMVANAYVRFRLPAEVGLIVLAAVGIQHLFNAKQKPATSFASE